MSIKPLNILNTEIKPGKTVLRLDIAKLHTRTSIDVPITIERGKKDGPVLLLLAGIHGNELNGVEIVRRIIKEKYNKPQKGTIICIPVVNVFGFLNQERDFPDGRDLNRVFPGNAKGSLAARFAHTIMKEIVPHADYIVDFHTGGDRRFNYSQIRIDKDDQECLELAKVFGTKFIVNSKNRDRSLRQAAVEMGKKVLLFEGGKSLHLDRKVSAQGINGTVKLIHHLGLRNFTTVISKMEKVKEQYLISSSSWLRARHSGMYRKTLNLGEHVEKGQKIGSISDPFGDFEKIVKTTKSGFIICSNQAPLVNQGDALLHIGFNVEKI
jgi:predicted deacylase